MKYFVLKCPASFVSDLFASWLVCFINGVNDLTPVMCADILEAKHQKRHGYKLLN